jgi:hypothetical protein
MNIELIKKISLCGCLTAVLLFSGSLRAQQLTLEGQTGGFLTPTAYVVYTDKGHIFSHPAVGYHFIDSDKVIGDVHTFNVTEGLANRAEFGYTRSVHLLGDSAAFSDLWNYSGLNVFHGKVVAVKDGHFGPWAPGLAVGGVVRLDDRFVSGELNKVLTGVSKSYTNGDVYVAVTKTWLHPPLPFIVNFGWKATNASIYGLGGQSTRFAGAFSAAWAFLCPDRSRRLSCLRPALASSRPKWRTWAKFWWAARRICPRPWTTLCALRKSRVRTSPSILASARWREISATPPPACLCPTRRPFL